MYHRTEGTAPASETLSRHNLPQTVDQPNTFTKLQVLSFICCFAGGPRILILLNTSP